VDFCSWMMTKECAELCFPVGFVRYKRDREDESCELQE